MISVVMVHVPDTDAGLYWYRQAFPAATLQIERDGFKYLQVDNVAIELVAADSKVTTGAAGSVVYWSTDNFTTRLAELLALGATLYRGPLLLENDLRMCQVLDPFGNPVGIRGPG